MQKQVQKDTCSNYKVLTHNNNYASAWHLTIDYATGQQRTTTRSYARNMRKQSNNNSK